MVDTGFHNILQTRWKRNTLIFVMSVVVALTFSPVLNNGFLTNWDDQWMVLDHPHLQQSDFSSVQAMLTEPYGNQYSPLNTLAYLAIIETGGLEPFGFQLVFLIVHILNFLLVGLVIQRLLQLIRGIDLAEEPRFIIAWGTAFLFAIHPLQVESVAWISASKIPLYSFFYLLGLWFYLMYKQSGKYLHLGAVLICFLASLLSKEQAVVFVVTLLLVDFVIHTGLKQKKFWVEKLPFLGIALLFGWFTLSFQGAPASGVAYPFWQRILFGNYSFWEYIIKLTAPYSLSHFYFFPMDPGEAIPLRFWFYPFATGLFVWLLIEYRDHINKIYLFGGLFFLINIALVLHVVPFPRSAIIADRYVYLSAIGFFLIVMYAGVRWSLNHQGFGRKMAVAVVSLYVVALAVYSHERNKVWKNQEVLLSDINLVLEQAKLESGAGFISGQSCYDR
jgi:hypothetical protein